MFRKKIIAAALIFAGVATGNPAGAATTEVCSDCLESSDCTGDCVCISELGLTCKYHGATLLNKRCSDVAVQ